MERYKLIEQKVWKHKNGARASIYGSCPWLNDNDKPNWRIVVVGFTIRDDKTGEVGRVGALYNPPAIDLTDREAVQSVVDTLNWSAS